MRVGPPTPAYREVRILVDSWPPRYQPEWYTPTIAFLNYWGERPERYRPLDMGGQRDVWKKWNQITQYIEIRGEQIQSHLTDEFCEAW